MNFMCDEMREGLLAGKKYQRDGIGSKRMVEVFMSDGELKYGSYGNHSYYSTYLKDMEADWEEVIEYPITFPEAMIAMNDGKTVENQYKTQYRIDVMDGQPILNFLYDGEWDMSKIPIISLMLWKWRIVE